MRINRRHKAFGVAAGFTAVALTLAACSGSTDETDASATPDETEAMEDITLTVATFNDFGYTDALLQEYMDLHPNVTVVQNIAATSNDARENFFTKLGPGGLADVEAIEVDWLPEVMQYSDLLADLGAGSDTEWLDWKTTAATDADGRLIGYGTDIGPEGVCYRADLFEAAGLPTDPDEVAALLNENGGDWDQFFAVGDTYYEATGKPFYDSAAAIWQGMINQMDAAYENPETGEVIAADNAELEEAFFAIAEASATLSSHNGQWSDDWFAGLADAESGYATMLCPGWMLGVIQGGAPELTGWNVANAFPGGGGNWGGSYLTVPANGANVEAATELAAWLTAPEQQLKALANAGTFPSQTSALDDADALNAAFASGDSPTKAEYFNNDNLGGLFSDRAAAVTVSPFKGEFYFQVNDVFNNGLTRIEDGTQDAQTSWDQAISELAAIG